MTDDALPAAPTDEACTRTLLLDSDADRVLEALTSAELLTAWLGEWSNDGDDERVVTDDGVTRRVRRLAAAADHVVAWRWSPADDPEQWTDVRFTVTTEGERTRLTVTETRLTRSTTVVASAAATAPAVSWLGCLMALGAVLAVGSPVTV